VISRSSNLIRQERLEVGERQGPQDDETDGARLRTGLWCCSTAHPFQGWLKLTLTDVEDWPGALLKLSKSALLHDEN